MDLANIDCEGHNDLYKNKSHGLHHHGIFCITGNDSGLVDISSIFDGDEMVI